MLTHLGHLIREEKPLDYYVIKYPKMVSAFFQCVNGKCPLEPYNINIERHIQMVIYEHNSDLLRFNFQYGSKYDYLYK